MVISDLVRAGTPVHVLLDELRQHVTPNEGLFLDTVNCRSPDGAEQRTSEFVRGALVPPFVNFTQQLRGPRAERPGKEVASMSRKPEYDLSAGFKYNGYPMRF
ncbi:hypothetical protein [Nannocystis pusilla]|uniref:hypothetical protein n=1 Tax=Nannocystis pusilla TaxID=889268 RepID=UPI003B8062F5